jgi:prepilin-type N-terminal cleavage/methylation domain-containing protein
MKRSAFTLIELLVAMAISAILIGASSSVYSLFRRSISQDQQTADFSQNARVALDRITRELRQTPDIVTDLPTDPSDPNTVEPHLIQFENGHLNDLSYLKYYLNGTRLEMDTIEYYFSYDPGHRVKWNAVGNGGAAPLNRVISTQDIADNVLDFSLYGVNSIQVIITTGDGLGSSYILRTTITPRN